MTRPLMSVIIPTWNRAHIICEAIESALSQKPGPVEVIVVDDCSTDKTVDLVARSFGSQVKLLPLLSRRGAGAARNAGIGLASGRLIAFLDSDDLFLSGKLDAELRVFERFPEAEAVISDSQSFMDGVAEKGTRFMRNGLLAASEGQVRWVSDCKWLWTNSQNGVATCSITVRREILDRLERPLFAEDVVRCEDWEFELRVYHFCRVVVMPEVWSEVRSYEDGTRVGRPLSGKVATREQEMGLLRDRLTVMERLHWAGGLGGELAAELERFHVETARRFAELAGYEEKRPCSAG